MKPRVVYLVMYLASEMVQMIPAVHFETTMPNDKDNDYVVCLNEPCLIASGLSESLPSAPQYVDVTLSNHGMGCTGSWTYVSGPCSMLARSDTQPLDYERDLSGSGLGSPLLIETTVFRAAKDARAIVLRATMHALMSGCAWNGHKYQGRRCTGERR